MQLYTKIFDFSKPWTAKKTALVLIHGLGANLEMWFLQIPDFAKIMPVITVDLPGCGKSPYCKNSMQIENIAKSLKDTLSVKNYQNYVFLGISLGGFIALEIANLFPKITAGVIFASTPYGFDEQIKPALFDKIKQYKKMSVEQIAKQRIPKAFHAPFDKRVIPYLVNMISQTNHNVYLEYAEAPLHYTARKQFKNIQCPVLVVTGNEDNLGGPIEAEKIKKDIPHAVVNILHETGHASSMDNPVKFNESVKHFLINKIQIEI